MVTIFRLICYVYSIFRFFGSSERIMKACFKNHARMAHPSQTHVVYFCVFFFKLFLSNWVYANTLTFVPYWGRRPLMLWLFGWIWINNLPKATSLYLLRVALLLLNWLSGWSTRSCLKFGDNGHFYNFQFLFSLCWTSTISDQREFPCSFILGCEMSNLYTRGNTI